MKLIEVLPVHRKKLLGYVNFEVIFIISPWEN